MSIELVVVYCLVDISNIIKFCIVINWYYSNVVIEVIVNNLNGWILII